MDFGSGSNVVPPVRVQGTMAPIVMLKAPSFSNEDAPNFGDNLKEDQQKRLMMEN
jgi:hypothetical protein